VTDIFTGPSAFSPAKWRHKRLGSKDVRSIFARFTPEVKGHIAASLRVGNDRGKLIVVLTQLLITLIDSNPQ
jgi:hypothetical protein